MPVIPAAEVKNCYDRIFGVDNKYECDETENVLFSKNLEDFDSDYESDDEPEVKQELLWDNNKKPIIHLSDTSLDAKHETFRNQIYEVDFRFFNFGV